MKLSNRSYSVQRMFKPFMIPFKIAGQMNTAVWEGVVNDAEMVIRSNESIKRTKKIPKADTVKGMVDFYVKKKADKKLKRQGIYKADESLIHEPFDLAGLRRSRKWNSI